MYLNCHSFFSLRYGTLSEVQLLDLAVDHKLDTIALTDINSTSAGLNFVRKAKEKKVKPVLGVETESNSAMYALLKITKAILNSITS